MTGGAKGGRGELDGALSLGAALLAGMYFVARAAANQFFYYSGEAAFAGLIAVLLGLCVALKSFLSPQPVRVPRGLALLVVLWIAVFAWGALRSPNWGVGVPLAADAGVYALLLFCGYHLAAPGNGALVHAAARAMAGMVAAEALAGVWQYYIDLPRLQMEVMLGHETLPVQLQTARGLARLGGSDVFGTFGNPNSLAAYLITGIWLLAGLCWNGARTQRAAGAIFAALMLWALLLTHSRGGLVACAAGGWFFAAQRISASRPKLRRPLFWLNMAGVAAMLGLLAAGYCGKINLGASMVERFGYWKSALAMFAAHPLEGVGLGGFAENFSFFKIALGKETREAHNDYLNLLAELGVLGPVLYLALWALLLRGRNGDAAAQQQPVADAGKTDRAMLAGGVLAFVLLYAAFQSFDSVELFRVFSEAANASTLPSIVQTFALPILFAFVIVTLRRQPGASAGDGEALWHGLRAAAGAVLVHQVIDFDFRAQAVIGGLLFLAGMMYARGPAISALAAPAPAWHERLLLPALAVALIPVAFWIPMSSGLARAAAENRDREADDLLKKKPADPGDPKADVKAAEQYRALRREAAEFRRAAVDAAPFDGSAWIELASAYETLWAADRSRPLRAEILDALKNGERLRPRASYPKIVLGDFYLRKALGDQRQGLMRQEDLDAALAYYSAGARRYPLAPGLRLLSGDALLLRGDAAAAALEYIEALAIDIAIDDVNVRLSGMFTNGYSSALPRHGHDGDILSELVRRLSDASAPLIPAAPRVEAGLQLRRVVALAGMIHEFRRRNALSAERLLQFQNEILRAADRLVALMPDVAERAHAALLAALCFELGGDDRGKGKAWARAAKLQEESRAASRPGTPGELFDFYYDRFAK